MKTRSTYEWLIEYTSHTVGVTAKEAKLILEYIERKDVGSLGKFKPSILLPMLHKLSGSPLWWEADGISLVALRYGLASIDPLCNILWNGLALDFFWTDLFQSPEVKRTVGGSMRIWQQRVERARWLAAVGVKNVLKWAFYDKGWSNLAVEEKNYVGDALSLAMRILDWGEINEWREQHREHAHWDDPGDILATEKVLKQIAEMGKLVW